MALDRQQNHQVRTPALSYIDHSDAIVSLCKSFVLVQGRSRKERCSQVVRPKASSQNDTMNQTTDG